MKKRGQITVFIIVGIVILSLFSIIYYTRNQLIKKEMQAGAKELAHHPFYIIPINRYVENCLKQAGDQGLWLIGIHGGYLDPDNKTFYGGDSIPQFNPPFIDYLGKKVPYYLDGLNLDTPSLGQIEAKLSKYIIVEFQRCLDLSIFDDVDITQPDVNYSAGYNTLNELVDSNVTINKENVVVELKYPLVIRRKDTVYSLPDFRVSLPVRLGMIYDTINNTAKFDEDTPSEDLLSDITTTWAAEETYYLSNFNCNLYDPSQDMTISATDEDNPPDPKTKIILAKDLNTFYHEYSSSYEFRFAIKMKKPPDFNGDEEHNTCYQEQPE